jgi:DNA-binding transcriptional LysR family regulator
MFNIHHLELFYHVARHGGIGMAVARMPYGIQQPAVSSQLIALEDELGTKLFQRRPFALTPAGRELYDFIQPFFGNLDAMAERLNGHARPKLRLGSTPTIIRNHLPQPLARVRERIPNFKLAVREIQPDQAEQLLRAQEIDLAVSFFERRPAGGVRHEVLAKFELMLVVPESAPFASALEAIRDGVRQGTSLISLPQHSATYRAFAGEIRELGFGWAPEIEVNSLDLIHTYVAGGFGTGLSVSIPRVPIPAGLRALPLPKFPPLQVALFWQGRLLPLASAFADELRAHVRSLRQPTAKSSGN